MPFRLALLCSVVTLGMVWPLDAAAQGWTPPIGIPTPSFGVTESAPARPSPWTGEQPGFYYVDAAAGCSDSRTYGFPGSARCTIPGSLPAGSSVELHGTYNTAHSFSWQGTAASPIFVRGQTYAARPLITASWSTSSGRYVVLENLHFGPASSGDTDFGINLNEGANHIAFRSIEISGNLNPSGGFWMGNWGYGGSAVVSEILLSNSHIHDIGDVNNTADRDAHCIGVNGSVANVWVLDNTLTGCEGDGMQIEAQHSRGVGKIHHIYFGRNRSSGHKQSGAWVKHASDVIISQNEFFGIQSSSSSEGQCTGAQYNPQRLWIIFNEIHDCEMGVFIGSDDGTDGTDGYIIGNVFYDIHNPSDPTNVYNAGAISARGLVNLYIVGNTMYDIDGGINGPPAGINFQIFNNIIAGRTVSGGSEIDVSNPAAASRADNNLFYRASGIRIRWDGTSYTTPSFAGTCGACKAGDPLFTDVAAGVFSVAGTSLAVDAGVAHSVYDTFETRYGPSLSIKYDVEGSPRPAGGTWDIGAYEYGAGAPPPPTNLRIVS